MSSFTASLKTHMMRLGLYSSGDSCGWVPRSNLMVQTQNRLSFHRHYAMTAISVSRHAGHPVSESQPLFLEFPMVTLDTAGWGQKGPVRGLCLSLGTLWSESMDNWILSLAKERKELERETRTNAGPQNKETGHCNKQSFFQFPSTNS